MKILSMKTAALGLALGAMLGHSELSGFWCLSKSRFPRDPCLGGGRVQLGYECSRAALVCLASELGSPES